jgi:regulator of protease activity HflC (stomatin/prohibitin superfamily)
MDPGCYCFFCTCCSARRVAVMITKNSIRYQCPIQNVPTKDNVMVSLDIGVNFHIGRNNESQEIQEEDTKRFFYNFGPNRLEELLQEECEEGIRDFVKKIKVARIRDIKTELTTELLQCLQNRFKEYGVVIEQVNIMNVIMPRDLRIALMATTNYDVYLQKQVKEQEYKMIKLVNNENKAILKLKRDNMQ